MFLVRIHAKFIKALVRESCNLSALLGKFSVKLIKARVMHRIHMLSFLSLRELGTDRHSVATAPEQGRLTEEDHTLNFNSCLYKQSNLAGAIFIMYKNCASCYVLTETFRGNCPTHVDTSQPAKKVGRDAAQHISDSFDDKTWPRSEFPFC